MFGVVGKKIEHAHPRLGSPTENSFELVYRSSVNSEPAILKVYHHHQCVGILYNLGEKPTLGQCRFDALLQSVGKLGQFAIEAGRFIERPLQLRRLLGKSTARFIQAGGKRTGLLGCQRSGGGRALGGSHLTFGLQQPHDWEKQL